MIQEQTLSNDEALTFYFQSMNKWLDTFCSRDFTKRQANILFFLLSFTVHTKNLTTHIPTLKDFEHCGVSPTKIKDELEFLVDKHVIFWDKGKMNFTINPYADQWNIKRFKNYKCERFKYLVELNKILTTHKIK
ncbi:replication protein (plasmid) [Priestia megaterium]